MKFENSKNTFSPENLQIAAYVHRNQIIITKLMWIKNDHKKKYYSSYHVLYTKSTVIYTVIYSFCIFLILE